MNAPRRPIGLHLLECLQACYPGWMTRSELASATGRSWPVVNRAINVLHRRHFVIHSGTGHYCIGPAGVLLLNRHPRNLP